MYGTLTASPASILGKCRANLIWLCFLLTFWPTFLCDASDTVACNGVQRHCNSILMLEDGSQAGRTVCGPACASEGAGASQLATGKLHARVDLGTPGGRGRLRTLLRLVRAARRLGLQGAGGAAPISLLLHGSRG